MSAAEWVSLCDNPLSASVSLLIRGGQKSLTLSQSLGLNEIMHMETLGDLNTKHIRLHYDCLIVFVVKLSAKGGK